MTIQHGPQSRGRRGVGAALAVAALGLTLAGCGGTATPPATTGAPVTTATVATGGGASTVAQAPVLPAASNPISNESSRAALAIDAVLVENNVDGSGHDVDDHLEFRLSNSGTTELSGFEIFVTFVEPATGTTESYYTALPDAFTIAGGSSRTVHFDNTGQPDHFPVNPYSLYATSREELEVTVVVSATDAAVQTTTVHKDAGGAETAD